MSHRFFKSFDELSITIDPDMLRGHQFKIENIGAFDYICECGLTKTVHHSGRSVIYFYHLYKKELEYQCPYSEDEHLVMDIVE